MTLPCLCNFILGESSCKASVCFLSSWVENMNMDFVNFYNWNTNFFLLDKIFVSHFYSFLIIIIFNIFIWVLYLLYIDICSIFLVPIKIKIFSFFIWILCILSFYSIFCGYCFCWYVNMLKPVHEGLRNDLRFFSVSHGCYVIYA